jgi:hypothetical protein
MQLIGAEKQRQNKGEKEGEKGMVIKKPNRKKGKVNKKINTQEKAKKVNKKKKAT